MNCAHAPSPPTAPLEQSGAYVVSEAAPPDAQMLICEMEHRIKNHLQMLAAYAHLLGKHRDLTGEEVAKDVAEKLWAVAGAHEALHIAGGRGYGQAAPFLRTLCRPFGSSPHRTDIDCDADLWLPADQLAPIGMIVSEALSNAVKHAFHRGQSGRLQVRLALSGQEFELVVQDNGHGLPATSASRLSGRALFVTLAQQLHGSALVQNRRGGGVEVIVKFPAAA